MDNNTLAVSGDSRDTIPVRQTQDTTGQLGPCALAFNCLLHRDALIN